jgi:hypothetical protein
MGHADVFFFCAAGKSCNLAVYGRAVQWVCSNVSHTALGATTPSSIHTDATQFVRRQVRERVLIFRPRTHSALTAS